MKIVVQVKLSPDPEQASALATTLHAVNAEANRVSELAFGLNEGARTRISLQSRVYASLKARGLSAQPAIHVVRKVADAYAVLNSSIRAGVLRGRGRTKATARPIQFRLDAAQPFDDRCLSWQYDKRTVSIWTLSGRIKGVRFKCSPGALETLRNYRKGESDLLIRNGVVYLIATCEIPEPPQINPNAWLGVDLGITNIATTSDGQILAGRRLNRYRHRQARLRAKLQRKGTKSAKRVLRRQDRKESRRTRDINHTIAKHIVTVAQRTERGIALEKLKGIRKRVRLRKPQRTAVHSWSFGQLGDFIQYKAKRVGIPVLFVDPAQTSIACAECNRVDRKNRVSQARFVCRSCGVIQHADVNASRNIASRAAVAWQRGALSTAPHPQRVPDAAQTPHPVVAVSCKSTTSVVGS